MEPHPLSELFSPPELDWNLLGVGMVLTDDHLQPKRRQRRKLFEAIVAPFRKISRYFQRDMPGIEHEVYYHDWTTARH